MTGSDLGIGDEDGVTRDEGGKTPYLGCNWRGVGEAAVILLTGEDQNPPPPLPSGLAVGDQSISELESTSWIT